MRNCCSRGNGRDYRRLRDTRYDRFGRSGGSRREGMVTGGFYWLAGWLGLPTWVVLAFFVVLQVLTGLSNVVLDWPLVAAVLHTGGAAALVTIVVWSLAVTRANAAVVADTAGPRTAQRLA